MEGLVQRMATKATVVPHHRIDAATHKAAKAKAKAAGISLSQVAEAGLKKYTASANAQIKSRAKQKVADGRLTREAPELPKSTSDEIAKMLETKDPRLSVFLSALRTAGWSYAALAKPMGVSRQAVHLRLAGWKNEDNIPSSSLPTVPPGPGHTTFPAHAAQTNDSPRFDWAIWVDRSLYAVASEQARVANEAMRDIMEQVLADYIAGRLVVSETIDAGKKGVAKR